MRHGCARRGAQQAERGLGLDRQFDVGQPQGLLRLIEHRCAPDMHIGFAANAAHQLRTPLTIAIVAEIVRAHGGSIEVGDAPGGGAKFSLRLVAI